MERIKKILKNNNRGFALLYSVAITSIILAIALSVSNTAYKESFFVTSAKDANDAFYAADTASECTLYYDSKDSNRNAFTGTGIMSCGGNVITIPASADFWTFKISQLGSSQKSCAVVTVDKRAGTTTRIDAVGYSNGGEDLVVGCVPTENSVQRAIQLNY